MDDLFGFLADRIAQQIKASREADAQQRRIAEAIASPSPPSAGRTPEPGRPVSRPPVVARPQAPSPRSFASPSSRVRTSPSIAPDVPAASSAQPPAYVAAPAERTRTVRPTRVALDDAFPTNFETSSVARPEPANALLRAFAGGNALLGALVLSEALAPPVALRNEPPHRP